MKNDKKNTINIRTAHSVRLLLMSGATAICLLFSFAGTCMERRIEIKPEETKKAEEQKRQEETQRTTESDSSASSASSSSKSIAPKHLQEITNPVLREIISMVDDIDVKSATGFIDSIKRLMKLRETSKTFRDLINKLLVERLGRLHLDTIHDGDGSNIIHAAIESGMPPAALTMLLQNMPARELAAAVLKRNRGHWTPLHLAIKQGKTDFLKTLLNLLSENERTTVVLETDSVGHTILHYVSQTRNLKALEILLNALPKEKRAEALLMRTDGGHTPLDWAVLTDAPELLEGMLNALPVEERARVLLMDDPDNGNTLIQNAARVSYPLLRILFNALSREERATALRIRDINGNTLLHRVALELRERYDLKYLKIIQALILVGANLEEKNNDGETVSDILQGMPKEWQAAITKIIKATLAKRAALEARRSAEHKTRESRPTPVAPTPTRQPSSLSAVEQERMDAERDRAHAASETPATRGTTSTLFITGQRPAVRRPQRPESFYERALGQTPPSTAAAASSRPAEPAAQEAARIEAILRNVDAAQGPITASGRPVVVRPPSASSSSSSTAAAGAWRTGGGSPQ